MNWLPDVNVWLALTLQGHIHHHSARAWADALPAEDMIHFCRATQTGLLRLLTTQAVMAPYDTAALTNKEAWKIQSQLRSAQYLGFVEEPVDLENVWKDYASRNTASPKLWMDAYIAAFATLSDMTVITTDRAFVQFKGAKVQLMV